MPTYAGERVRYNKSLRQALATCENTTQEDAVWETFTPMFVGYAKLACTAIAYSQ